MRHGTVTAEFHELGLGDPVAISSAHGDGVRELVDELLDRIAPPASEDDDETEDDDGPRRIKIAIVGRPNVGKSTLVNALLGEERMIAFDKPGTTRDSIHIDFDRAGKPYTLIDTAGLRRRGKVFEAVEKFSVVKTLQSVVRRERRRARARRAPGDLGPGRAHRGLRRRVRTRRRRRDQQVGRARRLRARAHQARRGAQAAVPRVRPHASHLGAEGAGHRRADEVGRRAPRPRLSRSCRRRSSRAR